MDTHQRQLWVHAGVNATVFSKRFTARTRRTAAATSDHGAVFTMENRRRHEHVRWEYACWHCDEVAVTNLIIT